MRLRETVAGSRLWIVLAWRLLAGMAAVLILPGVACATYADWHDTGGMPEHPPEHHSWDVVMGNDVFHNHHYYDHFDVGPPGDAVPGHKLGQRFWGAVQGDPYDPYSVWINETYHVYDGSAGGAVKEYFSHGFIIEQASTMPEFKFIGTEFWLYDEAGEKQDMRDEVRWAFNQWSGITQDDPHLLMGLEFREENPYDGDAAEITVAFVDYLPSDPGFVTYAQWGPADRTLEFARYFDAAKQNPIYWYAQDGDVKAMVDSHANADIYSTALHELGHCVGLDHQDDYDDIMYARAGLRPTYTLYGDAAYRAFAQDDILGARDLYSIPIPEPLTMLGLCLGVFGVGGYLRGRIRAA
ncbi:MAG: matrixin family metalloprotease [Planctomycetota bacterium]|nr:matrixin family metalloprotease [Planctomycetota bacterium]